MRSFWPLFLRSRSGSDAAAIAPGCGATAGKDDYFGTKVIDPYRWMEDAKSAEFQTWLKAQGQYTRAVLDAVPHYDDIAKALANDFSANPHRLQKVVAAGSRIFTLRKLSGKDGAVLFAGHCMR